MNKKKHAINIHQALVDEFGFPDWRPHLSPVGELVSTILSQNTNDSNRDAAYNSLQEQFPTWEQVRDAPEELVINAIRTAGLANQKGPAIQNALRTISEERGAIELDFLSSMSTQEASNWLEKLKGVGPKTAAIVLLFSLGMPAFPVDTHVFRVTGRLGIRPEGMTANKAHQFLARQFPPETFYPVHLNLIRLGREICKARKPLCISCPLNHMCDYYENLTK
ncbi:MAG TPA: endonuclease III [Chloroflexi bacterium]|nr:endonuclease III [Chloroflexota bacterium]